MSKKYDLLFVGAHTGNVLNGLAPPARLLSDLGHNVRVFLQEDQSAAESYRSGGSVATALSGINVEIVCQALGNADALICALSPVAGFNMETNALYTVNGCIRRKFGVQDFPGSFRNPGWRDYCDGFTTLFSPMPEPNFPGKCVVSGWGALEKWRGVNVKSMYLEARTLLGIGEKPVLYVTFSPEQESPLALEHLACLLEQNRFRDVAIVVNRHGREKTKPIAGNAIRYQSALLRLLKTNQVVDQSPEYADLPPENDYAVSSLFRPQQFLSYQQALVLTAKNGLALSFFGTDALVAPFLASQGVLSACWLDPVFGGAVLQREKQRAGFDLPELWQPKSDDELLKCLETGLKSTLPRGDKCEALSKLYPFPEKPAPEIIVDEIMRQLG